jgi:hypothetical protein
MIQLCSEAQLHIECERATAEKKYWVRRKMLDGRNLPISLCTQSVATEALRFVCAVFFAHTSEFLHSGATSAEIRLSAESLLTMLANEILASDKWPAFKPWPQNSPVSLEDFLEAKKRQVISSIKCHRKWLEFQTRLRALSALRYLKLSCPRQRSSASVNGSDKQVPANATSRTNAMASRQGSNHADVELFISKCQEETSVRITRRHIWSAVGHKTPRQFQYWQASSSKATAQDHQNFRRILTMSPTDFEALLKRKNIA